MARGKIAKKCAKAMKPSGVAWLGDIPEGWEMLPARHLFAEVTAKNKNGKYTRQLSFRYGEIVDKGPNQSHNAFPEETILTYTVVEPDTIMINGLNLNYDLLSLRVAIVKEAGIITSAYLAVVPQRSRIIPWYALYLLKAYDFKMVFHGQGSGIRMTLKFADFATLPITLPPLPEQRAIADYLDEKCGAIDVAIAEAKKGIEEYKAWKKSLIFETVTGKRRVGVFNAETQRRREVEKMKPSGIPWVGAIPAGWRVVKASRLIASTQNGLTRRNLSESKGDIVLRLKNISPDGYIDYSDVVRIELSEKEKDTYCLTEGDLLFARVNGSRGLVGKCAVFVDNEECVAYNDHLIRVRVNGIVVRSFITYYLSSQSGRTEIELHTSTSAGQFTISGEGLRDIAVVLPPLPEQQAIADYLDETCAAIDAMVTEKEALISDLEAYKKSLIYDTVTGKREVA